MRVREHAYQEHNMQHNENFTQHGASSAIVSQRRAVALLSVKNHLLRHFYRWNTFFLLRYTFHKDLVIRRYEISIPTFFSDIFVGSAES